MHTPQGRVPKSMNSMQETGGRVGGWLPRFARKGRSWPTARAWEWGEGGELRCAGLPLVLIWG